MCSTRTPGTLLGADELLFGFSASGRCRIPRHAFFPDEDLDDRDERVC